MPEPKTMFRAQKWRFSSRCSTLLLLAATAIAVAETAAGPVTDNLLPERGQSDHIWITLEDYEAPHTTPGLAHNDLLQHLRDGFSFDQEMNRRTEAELQWYTGHPDYLNRVFTRGQRYLPYITEQLEARGLPLELALLPVVESAYDPFAYSHGRAAGLWQIIPGTARRFGIRQNWWYDGRRDIVDSTDAALKYLSYLHDLTHEDWLLAIASYNSGEGNVLKAVRRNQARSQATDFWHLKLSRETSSYVPKLLALAAIVENPAAFGLTLPEVLYEPQFAVADIGGQLDLALAAQLAGTDLDTLYKLNSGFNRWSTDPAGPHRLLLPTQSAATFSAALAEVPASERVRWQRHKVRTGDSLSEIAERYHTTPASIRAVNNIRGNMIRAGSALLIPMATRPLSDYRQTADARRSTTQNRQRSGIRVEHIVRAGESFWSIGQRYGVSSRQIASWNGTAPRDTLSVGQKLVVWTDRAEPAAAVPGNNGITRRLRYTVRTGDSLYLIASRFRITVKDLLRWNKIDVKKILRPGQTLTMYVDVTAQSS